MVDLIGTTADLFAAQRLVADIVAGGGQQVEFYAVEEDCVVAQHQARDTRRDRRARRDLVIDALRRNRGGKIAAGVEVVVGNRVAGEEALVAGDRDLKVAGKADTALHIHDRGDITIGVGRAVGGEIGEERTGDIDYAGVGVLTARIGIGVVISITSGGFDRDQVGIASVVGATGDIRQRRAQQNAQCR